MTTTETMKLALETLEAFLRFAAIHHDGPDTSDKYLAEDYAVEGFRKARQVLPALRTAIAEAEKQEPVAFYWEPSDDVVLAKHWTADKPPEGWTPLYTTPPAAQRQPLTDEQISDLWCEVSNTDFVTADTHVFARAIEAAHGITGEKK